MPRRALPSFVEPMLARPGEPFDSPDHLYEVKWDGFRALAFVEHGRFRLVGRRRTDFTDSFPELADLARLPDGCVVDGEIVCMTAGRPDFAVLLARQRRRGHGPTRCPATFVAFDLLYERFRPLLDEPCEARRQRLERAVQEVSSPRLALSRAVVGEGHALFDEARAMGLEGVIAKRRAGRYEPGERSGSWVKFKGRQELLCAIIGYEPSEERGLRSLIVAAPVEGELRCVGQVGSGITAEMHDRLLRLLAARTCKAPVVACTIKGKWVVPDLFCRVSFLEWTKTGKLRGPVFASLHGT